MFDEECKIIIFNFGFSVKLLAYIRQNWALFKLKNDDVYHIIDQIKVWRVPLWIGNAPLLNERSIA